MPDSGGGDSNDLDRFVKFNKSLTKNKSEYPYALLSPGEPRNYIYRTKRPTGEPVVYVIKCMQSGYYVGITHDIQRRLRDQRTLKGSCRFIKEHGGMDYLVYAEAARTRVGAKKRKAELTKLVVNSAG